MPTKQDITQYCRGNRFVAVRGGKTSYVPRRAQALALAGPQGQAYELADVPSRSVRRNPEISPETTPAEDAYKLDIGAITFCGGIVALLIAMRTMYQSAHWQAHGPGFYGDHKLFSDLYKSVEAEYDTLAEKVTAGGGAYVVDLDNLAPAIKSSSMLWARVADPFERGLKAEADLAATINELLNSGFKVPRGLQTFLESILDAHGKNVYFLTQRADSLRENPARRTRYCR
jgi:DNA-binding ferritin-like protein